MMMGFTEVSVGLKPARRSPKCLEDSLSLPLNPRVGVENLVSGWVGESAARTSIGEFRCLTWAANDILWKQDSLAAILTAAR